MMVKIKGIEGKEIKFICKDGFSVRCFGDGTIYEDVNNYYCIPNFHSMEAAGVYSKYEFTMRVVG